jgi:hypothetical protein
MTNDNSGCGKVIVILGVVASIIAIFTFITGVVSIRDFFDTPQQPVDNPPPTNFNQPESTVALPLTDTPQPISTNTFAPTSIPAEASLPDTAPGTILEFGQTWRQGGLELTMTESGWGGNGDWMDEGGGVFTFILTNLEPNDRSFRFSSDNFSAVDNFGRSVPIIPKQNISINEYCPSDTVQLPANQTIDLVYELRCSQNKDMAFALTPRIDAGDTSITEIIVSISVSSISNAKWRIKIYH